MRRGSREGARLPWRAMAGLVAALAALAAGGCRKDVVVPCPIFSPMALTVSPQTAKMSPGDSVVFRGLVTGGFSEPYSCGGMTYQPTPRAVTWTTSNASVASIVRSTDSTAVIRAAGAGTATVLATAVVDATMKGAALVSVDPHVPAP